MATNLKIEGNFFVLSDTDTLSDIFRKPRSITTYEYQDQSGSDVFIFESLNNQVRDRESIDFTDIIDDRTGSAFSSVDELKSFLSENIGFFLDIDGAIVLIDDIITENNTSVITRPSDYNSEVAMDKRSGRTTVNKWGVNTNVSSAAPEIVASFGGGFDPATNVMTTAQTYTITYDNTVDGLGQSGALSLLITHIDASAISQSEIHVLSNTGSDVTSFSGLGINRCLVLSNGGLGWNSDDITITATTDGTNQAQVPAGKGVTQQALFHTQINHKLLTDWLFLNALKDSGGGNPKVTFTMYSWSRVTLTRYTVFEYKIDTTNESSRELRPTQKFPFGGREVIWIEADASSSNTSVSARFSGIEEQIN